METTKANEAVVVNTTVHTAVTRGGWASVNLCGSAALAETAKTPRQTLEGMNPACSKCKERLDAIGTSMNRLASALRSEAQVAAERYIIEAYSARYAATRVEQKAEDVIESLQRAAVQVERALLQHRHDPRARFDHLVSAVMHEVLWMVPNLGLDNMVREAADVDRAAARMAALKAQAEGGR